MRDLLFVSLLEERILIARQMNEREDIGRAELMWIYIERKRIPYNLASTNNKLDEQSQVQESV